MDPLTEKPDPEFLVQIRNLNYRIGNRAIHKDINLDIPRGKVTTIMGPSGCGKTTLLRLIGGQARAHSGQILVDGINVGRLDLNGLFTLRKRMGMMFQSGALFTDLSVFDNIAFPLREHTTLSESMVRHIVLMKLQAVGLRGARELFPAELSGGMARRVALARAIALDPMMIMYDEPFTGQDPITVGIIMQLIRLLNDTLGLTSIIVSHDVQEVCTISDQLFMLSDGKVISHGSPDQMKRSDSEAVQQFMHAFPDGPVAFHYPAADYFEDLMQT